MVVEKVINYQLPIDSRDFPTIIIELKDQKFNIRRVPVIADTVV